MNEEHWINIADALPPIAKEVWAYDDEEGVIAATYGRFGWDHIYGDDDGLRYSKLCRVTHWMPIDKPDPPPSGQRTSPREIALRFGKLRKEEEKYV